MFSKKIGCALVSCLAALTAGLVAAPCQAISIRPGGIGALGTVHYLNENVALGSGFGGNALPDIGGVYVTPATAGFGPSNGSAGNNGDTSESPNSGLGVYTANSPMTWRANFSSRTGTPNMANQSYAIGQIRVYGRANGASGESDAFITVLEQGMPAAVANGLLADFPGPPNPVTFNFTGNTLIGQKLQYVSRVPNGVGAYTFSEIQASGISNLILGGDTLDLEISPTGNDYLNIQGTATLNGLLKVTTINGATLTPGNTYNLLTASSINFSGLSFDPSISSQFLALSLISGGQGQILQLTILPVPEPSMLMLASLGMLFLVQRRKRNEALRID